MKQKGLLCSFDRAKSIKKELNDNDDIVLRKIGLGKTEACLIFIDNIVNAEDINFGIINSINEFRKNFSDKEKIRLDKLCNYFTAFCDVEIIEKDLINEKILKGFAILLLDRESEALCFNVVKHDGRGVEEPPSSTVISGPREGFTENIKTNLGLIRKRIASSRFKIEDLSLGERTKTTIKLVYFTDLIEKDTIEKIKDKLSKVKIDGIIDSYYIGSILEDRPNSIFRQVGSCEKPDILCAKILEGRVGILVDGSPVVLTLPFILLEDLQSSNDYYSEPHRASMLRILRMIALFLSIYIPGMYIALQLFHYKVLPLKFLVTIINTTQNLPLNPFLEIFFIIVLFDVLFEASLRMPKYLGIAVSIVGALILGDTAVKAGLVSPPGVMIVAMSAITIYIIPNQSSQISLLRFVFAFVGGILGFHGIILGTMLMLGYLANIDSYGSPYLAPYAPYVSKDQKDAFIKDNLLSMKERPKSFLNNKETRLKVKKTKQKDEEEKPR